VIKAKGHNRSAKTLNAADKKVLQGISERLWVRSSEKNFTVEPTANDGLVWHYTTIDTACKILEPETLQLRATNIAYMNDAAEFHHCVDSLDDCLKRYVTENQFDGKAETKVIFAEALRRACRHMAAEPNSYFVSCFSGRYDDLSQWRAYGAQGAGIALGFSAEGLEVVGEHDGYEFSKCRYDSGFIEACAADTIETLESGCSARLKSLRTERKDSYVRKLADCAMWDLLALAPTFKHDAFAAEDEYRAIFNFDRQPLRPLGFVSGVNIVKPYVLLDVEQDREERVWEVLKKVLVGPGPHMDLVASAMRDLLSSKGRGSVRVVNSRIPYRPL